MILGCLAPQGPKFFFKKTLASIFPPSCLLVVVMFTTVAPLVGVTRKILVVGIMFSKTSMAAPLGVLSAGPTAATIGGRDIDGGPLKGCCQQVLQRSPLELETLMAGP
jgi:hypothetical protein